MIHLAAARQPTILAEDILRGVEQSVSTASGKSWRYDCPTEIKSPTDARILSVLASLTAKGVSAKAGFDTDSETPQHLDVVGALFAEIEADKLVVIYGT